MKSDYKDISFLVFVIVVLILSALYFFVPERILFMENQINWWSEFWGAMKSLWT